MTAEFAPVRIVVVRHGATALTGEVLNGGGAHAADPPLTQAGIDDLIRVRQLLTGAAPEFAWSSPARRARESARALGWPEPRVDPLLAEVDFGSWEGRSPSTIAAEAHARWWSDPAAQAPEAATSVATVADGLRGWIAQRQQDCAGLTIGLAGHATTVRIVVAHALNLPLPDSLRLSVPPAGAAVVRFWPDGGSCLDTFLAPPEPGD